MKEVPDPRGGYPTSYFIGHYGETIELAHDWTAEPSMRDEVEVVRLHANHSDQWERHPYRPAESDYRPENFTPMGLIQLIVIPKNAPGGLSTLKSIRRAKEAELRRSNIDYEFRDDVLPSAWPPGSFIVRTSSPYRLRQVYAESPNEFFILTMGEEPNEGEGGKKFQVEDVIYAQEKVRQSLSRYLLALSHKSAQSADCDWFGYFRTTGRFWKILSAFIISMLGLIFWPGAGSWALKARLLGSSLLSFVLISGLAGFLVVFIPGQFGIYIPIDGAFATVPAVLFPMMSWIAARRFGSSRPKRVLAWSSALAVPWAVFLYQPQGEVLGDARAFLSTSTFLLAGLVFGIVFFLAFGPRTETSQP